MDVTEVKDLLQITTDKHDSYIATSLPLMQEAVEDHCNKQFDDPMPGGVRVAIAKWIEYNMHTAGIQSRSQGVSYSYDTSIPDSIKSHLRPHRRLKW